MEPFEFKYVSQPEGLAKMEFHFTIRAADEATAATNFSAYLADIAAQHAAANGTDEAPKPPRKAAAKKAATKKAAAPNAS